MKQYIPKQVKAIDDLSPHILEMAMHWLPVFRTLAAHDRLDAVGPVPLHTPHGQLLKDLWLCGYIDIAGADVEGVPYVRLEGVRR